MNQEQILEIFRNNLLFNERMMCSSKTMYITRFPEHEVVFNANVFNDTQKIWWGDLDLTLDSERLQKISQELGMNLHVLRECDGKLDNEELLSETIVEKSVKTFKPNYDKDL